VSYESQAERVMPQQIQLITFHINEVDTCYNPNLSICFEDNTDDASLT